MGLTEEQKEMYDGIMVDIEEIQQGDIFGEHNRMSLTGQAGSGKTWLSKSIVESLMDRRMKVAVLAPTHQAVGVIRDTIDITNKNLVFATVHAFLGLKPGEINPETGERKYKKTTGKDASPLTKMVVDIVILDESSMVSEELYDFLRKELYNSKRIKSVLFLGDKFQLPAVEPQDDNTEIKSVIYDDKTINQYELTKLIRNSDMEVINFVTDIRNMIERKATKLDLFEYLVEERDKPHNKIKFYNTKKKFLKEFIKTDRLMNTSDTIVTFTNNNVDSYNEKLRDYYTTKKYGECPEITTNDLFVVQEGDENFLNSEIIKLKSFSKKLYDFKGKKFKGYFCNTKDGRHFNYISKESKEDYDRACELLKLHATKTKNRNNWLLYFELRSLFLGVKYHYSMTIHKSQGSSYENIWIDCSNLSYTSNQLLLRLFYVAATRSKNNVNILL